LIENNELQILNQGKKRVILNYPHLLTGIEKGNLVCLLTQVLAITKDLTAKFEELGNFAYSELGELAECCQKVGLLFSSLLPIF
jgi:hypothetical protein